VNVAAFADLALGLPEAVQSSHFGSIDFRVRGKIFAQPAAAGRACAIVKFTPEQQELRCAAEPGLFAPEPGHWGRCGWTRLDLATADAVTVHDALWTAWRNVAPKRLVQAHPAPDWGAG
jgi:hypothetical protein